MCTDINISGVFGLSPNYGRVPFQNEALSYTTIHVGPLAATARDTALGYALVGRPVLGHFYQKLYNDIPGAELPSFSKKEKLDLKIGNSTLFNHYSRI